MDWLRLAEFLKLKMLPTLRESCADEYGCVDVDDDAFLCARRVEVIDWMLVVPHLEHQTTHQ